MWKVKGRRERLKRLKKPINLSSILDVPPLLDHILTSFLFFLPWAAVTSAVSQGTSGGTAIVQETLPLQAATQATLGNASWYSYHCSQQLCPPIRDPSNSGSDVINLPPYDDSGETDFIDLFDYNKADVIQDSAPVQSVQGRIAARKAWWFNNLQLSALVFGGFIELLHDPIRCSTSTFVS